MLVLVRPDGCVRLCKGIDDSFAMSGVVDNVMDCKLLLFLQLESHRHLIACIHLKNERLDMPTHPEICQDGHELWE